MFLTVSNGGPPPGHYLAKFTGIESVTHEEYGPGVKWKWEILQGEHAGKMAARTTGTAASVKNACGKMLAGVLGRELKQGEQVDLDQLVGREFLIVVAPTEGGSTRVEAAVPKS
jgi:hypothetical protein